MLAFAYIRHGLRRITTMRYAIELRGLDDWRSRLGAPDKHWKRGASAMELAIAWTGARRLPRGLPPPVAAVLDAEPALAGASLLLAVPELRTALPGGSSASQTDLWALLRKGPELISLAIEGKAREPFGAAVGAWMGSAPSVGRRDRLAYLCFVLGIGDTAAETLRYQLLHRAAAALMEADTWGAGVAVMLVQRFADESRIAPASSWADFEAFAQRLGVIPVVGKLHRAVVPRSRVLYIGWLDCAMATDSQVASEMTTENR